MPPSTALPDALAAGSLVRLISGGPLMTVLYDRMIGSERKVECTWFDGGGHRLEAKLPRASIAPAPGTEIADRVAQQVYQQAMMATVHLDRIARALAVIDGADVGENEAEQFALVRSILVGQ